MKFMFFGMMLVCVPLTGAASQSCTMETAAQTVATITRLNEEYIDAARTGDTAWFSRHMADDVLVVLSNGQRLEKPAFLAVAAGTPRGALRSLVARNVTVRLIGEAVQVDAESHYERANGASGVSRYIDTYAWRDCRWQVVSAQVTPVPMPQERDGP